MNISVIGTGYVGLVSGACFAKMGHQVLCMDIDQKKIDLLKKGIPPIYEPGIESLLNEIIAAGTIGFSSDLAYTVEHADVLFLALPTPSDEDGSADLQYVMQASSDIAKLLKKYTVIVNKSTVPVGSSVAVTETMRQYCDEKLFDVVSNPEFLREGKAISDFFDPDRVVIGTQTDKAKEIMNEVYDSMKERTQIIHMDCKSSEMTKYVANTFLAMKISFMNEMSRLSEDLGANIECVKEGIASDHRIGPYFINPGIGYGGSCFPKDVLALDHMASQTGKNLDILPMIIQGNKHQRAFFIDKIVDYLGDGARDKKVAIWGLSFKPDTDDIREAPALELIEKLASMQVSMSAHDPQAMDHVENHYGNNTDIMDFIRFEQDKYKTLAGADALVIVTEWDEYLHMDFEKAKSLMNDFCIIDGRNCFELDDMSLVGCRYVSIGRPSVGL